jgi:thiamine pyrophosphate-dependent acetolactate synthase large subunit-like protein
MLSKDELLKTLAEHRTDEAVVTCMGVTRPWGRTSDHDLDFASADSAMGHTADLALGIALAQPARKVLCLNGDGSMLMTLGTLVTIVDSGAENLVLFVLENGKYEITGNQKIPGAGWVDFPGLARAAGFPRVYDLAFPRDFKAVLPRILSAEGPIFVGIQMEEGSEGPISRSEKEEARYLKTSLADCSRAFRKAIMSS